MKASVENGKGRKAKERRRHFYLYKENKGFLTFGVYKENAGYLSCLKSDYTLNTSEAYLFCTEGLDCIDAHDKSYKMSWDSVSSTFGLFHSDIKIVECWLTANDIARWARWDKVKEGRKLFTLWYENKGFISKFDESCPTEDSLEARLSPADADHFRATDVDFTLNSSGAHLYSAESLIVLEYMFGTDVDWNKIVRVWKPLKYKFG